MLNIIIADDHAMLRAGLKSLLESETGFRVIGEAGNGRDLVKLVLEKNPDIAILDISMPELNGIEATRRIRTSGAKTRVIALSMHSDLSYVKSMLQADASGYILKDNAFEELSLAISLVAAGQTYLSPQISDLIAKDYVRQLSVKRTKNANDAPDGLLSTREREVLQLIAEGKSTKDIAGLLNISIKTVESHRKQIMDKLDIRTVAELTKYAIRFGLTALE